MTRPIDEKIVAMKMDNSDFKQKAIETTGLFGKLRESLSKIPGVDLTRVSKSVSGINSAANRVDMSSLSRSIDSIASRFSNLGIVATTALVNITNRAVDAGARIGKSLTVEPVMDGFREYENKMGAIGTMLANTEWAGSTLDDVKKTLGELNDYADNTIYSFEQMTTNVGRFTAAGVTLEDSAIAIKGLGNLAAISGSDVNQLNSAMYQSSQALASGKLNLEDWNSLVNAGMAGKKTQDALVATARAMGQNVDLSEGFRNSIQDGWLTSEVFLATLKKFGEDDSMTKAATSVRTFTGMMAALKEGIGSGWATTWELIFGDFEVATERWTALSNVLSSFFQKGSDARNSFVKSLADNGVFDTMFKVVTNGGESVLKVMDAMGSGIRKAFGWIDTGVIVKMAAGFKDFASSLKPSEKTLNNISTIFQGVFSVIATGVVLIIRLGKAIIDIIPDDLFSKIIGFTASISKMVIAFTESIRSGKDASSSFSGLAGIFASMGSGVNWLVKQFSNLGSAISEAWSILLKGDFTGKGPWAEDSKIVGWLFKIRETTKSVVDYIGSINLSLAPVTNGFQNFFDSIRSGFNWVVEKISELGTAIKNSLPEGNTILAGGFLAGLVGILGMAIKMGWDLWQMFTGWGEIGRGVSDVLEGVSGALNAFTTSIYANALVTIAIGIGILAVAFKIMSTIDAKHLANSLYAISAALMAMIGGMAIMTKYDITGAGMKSALTMVAMGAAILIMSGALEKLAGLKTGEITKGIYGLVGIMGTLAGAVVLMSKFGGSNITMSAVQILALATSIHILISAVKRISEIDTGKLVKGVSTLGIIMLELALFMKIAGGSKFGIGSALAMLAVGQAVINITDAINEIAKIKVNDLKTGLVTIGAIFIIIASFAQLTSGTGLLASSVGILLLSAALTALIVPVQAFGTMDLPVLAIGLGAIAVALTAIGAASKLMTGMVAAGIGIVGIAIGLTLLLAPIKAFSEMSWEGLLKGLVGVGGSLLILGGAALLLAPAVVPMMAFSGAVAILGIGMLAAGAGMALFATGLVTLATMISGGVMTIVATLTTLIIGMASLIPLAVKFVWNLIHKMAEAFVENAPKLADTMLDGLLRMLDVIAKNIPKFVDAAVKIITNFLDALSNNIPKLVTSATNLMITFIETLASAVEKNGPKFLNAWMRLMAETTILIVKAGIAVVQALFGWIPGVTDATNKIGDKAEQTIRDAFDAKGAGTDKGKDFNSAITSSKGGAETAGKNVAKSVEKGVDTTDLDSIGDIKGMEFATALASNTGSAQTSGISLANAGQVGASSVSLATTGSNFGAGFAGGISSAYDTVVSAAKSLASAAKNAVEKWLDIRSPSREMAKVGKHTSEGFAVGISAKKDAVAKSATQVAKEAKDKFKNAMGDAEYKYRMGIIDADQYISVLKNMKKQYSKYGDVVKTINAEIKDAQNTVNKTKSDSYKKWAESDRKLIEVKKEQNQLTLKQELKMWEALVAKYRVGTQEKINAEKEVKRVKDEIYRQEIESDKKLIETKKYYNQLSLAEELRMWETMSAKYRAGTEEKINAEREIYRIKNEINTQLIAINEEYTGKIEAANKRLMDSEAELNNKYGQSVRDRTNALVGFAGIFDEITQKSEVSGEKLITNLQSQVATFTEWSENIEALASRGINKGLLEELRQMGPKAAAEIKALNTLSDEQLTQYSNLWRSKNELAHEQAINELEGLRLDTIDQINKLRAESKVELETYKQEWVAKIGEIRTGTENKFVGINTSMTKIGEDSMAGLKQGLLNMEGPLMSEASRIASAIAATIRSALQVRSPSRVTTKIGEYTGEGLAVGLANKTSQVVKSAKNLATTAKDSLNQFLEGLELPEDDYEVRLKVVMDYDSLDRSKLNLRPIRVLPDTSLTSGLATATKLNLRQNNNTTPTVENRQQTPNSQSTVINQHMTFNSPQLSPSEVARKNLQASRQLAMEWGT